ncbi:MAG: hypothetical protein ACR2MS_01285 [Weeksellaceae bacterium]
MKKLNPSLVGFIIALLICAISLWIYFSFIQRKNIQLIDNPTGVSIQVEINNQSYSIAPDQYVEVNLKKGKYTIAVKSEVDSLNLPETTFTVNTQRGVINPVRANYFIYGMPYGPTVNKDSIFSQRNLTYAGKTYAGDVRLDSSIYIENFYYNLNEDFPPVALKSENNSLRRKIFREAEFKQFYFERYE